VRENTTFGRGVPNAFARLERAIRASK